ncbi:hypothetical protein GPJ56_008492 [Histomonas meleagridis]|uniref:uncharacterized protein n=1 Tax=Histomonas meleagridis TaxID=135588 RepID=UPI003559C018|nr:hypothetical protein GPJ56_008492 [Histomonas meleagridis]KAH0797686.1 hypothetical protein GO595_009315 [Histomonas meleagridis]
MCAEAVKIRPSAKRLRELYRELDERNRSSLANKYSLKNIFPMIILPKDKDVIPLQNWFLMRMKLSKPFTSKKTIPSMLMIYGFVVEWHEDKYPKPDYSTDYFVRFEDDDQVEAAIIASRKKRIRVGSQIVKCYRVTEVR